MSKVLVTETYLEDIADAIRSKNGSTDTYTPAEMASAISDISGGVTPTGNINITHAGQTDVTNYATATVPTASVYTEAADMGFTTVDGVFEWHTKARTVVDPNEGDVEGWIAAGDYDGPTHSYRAVPANTTITPTTSAQTVGGTKFMMEGAVTVAAMPTGSATTPATSITANPSISVSNSGLITATASASKSVTPTVSAGYISSGNAGTVTVSGSNTQQLTTQAAQTIYPSSSDQSISSGKYLTGAQTIKAVTTTNLTAENIKSGVTVQVGDSADSDRVLSVTGTYSGGSSMNIQIDNQYKRRTANSYGDTGLTLTVAKTGTYTVSWVAWRGSSSGTMGTNLHVNSTTGTNQQTWTGTYGQLITLTNQSYNQGDVLKLYATSGSNSRSIYVANLTIIQTA